MTRPLVRLLRSRTTTTVLVALAMLGHLRAVTRVCDLEAARTAAPTMGCDAAPGPQHSHSPEKAPTNRAPDCPLTFSCAVAIVASVAVTADHAAPSAMAVPAWTGRMPLSRIAAPEPPPPRA